MNIDSPSSAERCWGVRGGVCDEQNEADGAEKRGRRLGPTVIMMAIMMMVMVMTASVISPHDGSHPSTRARARRCRIEHVTTPPETRLSTETTTANTTVKTLYYRKSMRIIFAWNLFCLGVCRLPSVCHKPQFDYFSAERADVTQKRLKSLILDHITR